MKNIFLGFLIIFTAEVTMAGSGVTKPSNDILSGKWLGYCAPQADSKTSRMCSYTFKKDGSGTYQCDYYKDLRCATKDTKSTSSPFHFSIANGDGKTGKVNIEFSDREDVKEERSRYYISGDVLRFQVYQFMRLPAESKDTKEESSEAQGIVPFFEYTREKQN